MGPAGRRWGRAETVAVSVPAAVMLAVGTWGLDRGGMWGDEGVTFLVGRRTVPQIWRLLHGVDAVHGLYYLFMHAVLTVDAGEVVLRLPSLCGAVAAAGLVAALGVRLAGPRVGLWAGLLYAVTPLTGHYAQEGRSYALVAAGVAGVTLLLVTGLEGRPGRTWWWYGGVLAVTCVLHELAVLVVCAHAVTLALARAPRRVWRGWVSAVAAAGVVLAPLVWVSRAQSGQVGWLVRPGWDQAGELLRGFAAGPDGVVFWGCVLLMAVGAAGRVGVVAGPLLVVPPAVLMTVSQVRPLYHERYVLYALAGASLLVAAGGERVARAMGGLRSGGRRVPALAGVLLIAVVFLQQLPLYRHDRSPDHRPENLAAVSALAAREIRPGDPVLFLPSVWRVTALAYPGDFSKARDIALGRSGAGSGTLSGLETTPRVLRHRLAEEDRVWVVADSRLLRPSSYPRPRDPVERLKLAALGEQFTPRGQYVSGRVTLRLYVRRTSATPTSATRTPTTLASATPAPSAAVPAAGPVPPTQRPRPARS